MGATNIPGLDNPRIAIENLLRDEDLHGLLNHAASVHGHYCPGLAMGVKAAAIAVRQMNLISSDGMESVMAVVECNNCFVDGIQAVSGCTLGNNSLIYKDLGKVAVTFYRRGSDEGLRLIARRMGSADPEPWEEEARALFNRAVKKRETLSTDERTRFQQLWRRSSFKTVDQPDDAVYQWQTVTPDKIEYAPMYDSVTCARCGESAMETRIHLRDGESVCMDCACEQPWGVVGRGIRLMANRDLACD